MRRNLNRPRPHRKLYRVYFLVKFWNLRYDWYMDSRQCLHQFHRRFHYPLVYRHLDYYQYLQKIDFFFYMLYFILLFIYLLITVILPSSSSFRSSASSPTFSSTSTGLSVLRSVFLLSIFGNNLGAVISLGNGTGGFV